MDDAQVEITHLRLQLSEFINRNTLLMLQFEDSQRKVRALQAEVDKLNAAIITGGAIVHDAKPE